MGDKRRRSDQDKFLNNHFSSGGKLAVNDSIRGAGRDVLKQVVLSILEEGETVTRCGSLGVKEKSEGITSLNSSTSHPVYGPKFIPFSFKAIPGQ